MKMFIPALYTKIELTEDWTINLHPDNCFSLGDYLGIKDAWTAILYTERQPVPVILIAGTQLSVDRIYVRRNKTDYDSITFRLINKRKGYSGSVRFWVNLEDANNIEFKLI